MNKWLYALGLLVVLAGCNLKEKPSIQVDYKSMCNSTIYDYYSDSAQKILYYPDKESIYFQPKLAGFDSIKVAINCLNIYNEKCWRAYNGDSILLNNRSKESNGWANGPFTNYIPQYLNEFVEIDLKAERNNLKKLNVVRFKLFKDTSQFEQVYHIGVGIEKPNGAIAIIDYEDYNQMVGPNGNYSTGSGFSGHCDELDKDVVVGANYIVQTNKVPEYRCAGMTRCFIEKPVLFSFYNASGDLKLQQHVGSSISANASAHYPAKGLQVVARSHYGKKRMKATFFESEEKYKNIRVRLGGTGQFSYPCQHVMDPICHDIYGKRGLKNEYVNVYLNGVQWGSGYLQEKLDEHYVEKCYGFDEQYVDIVEIIGQSNKGLVCQDTANTKRLAKDGLLDKLGYHQYLSFTDDYCWLASVKDGNGKAFSKFYAEAMNGDFSKLNEESLWDYVAHIDFLTLKDAGRNNTMFFCSDRRDPEWFVQGMDFDHSFIEDVASDHWVFILNTKDSDPFRNILRKYFEKSDNRNLFIQRYQDLLNTRYNLNRIIPLVNKRLEEFELEVDEHQYAWEPNSLDAEVWRAKCYNRPYLQEWLFRRHYAVKHHLAIVFMGEAGFNVEDQKKIKVIFPKELEFAEDFQLQLNSLQITEDFEGLYFPFPAVKLSIENIPEGYEFIGWKGLEDAKDLSIEVFLKKDIMIEPVFKPKS